MKGFGDTTTECGNSTVIEVYIDHVLGHRQQFTILFFLQRIKEYFTAVNSLIHFHLAN